MIKIERNSHPIDSLMDKKKDEELKRVRSLYSRGQKPKLQTLWSEDKVKHFLYQSQYGKCCYCERKRDEKAETDVEHFRPKAKLQETLNHLGYWWLAYNWDNLLISCKKCNQHKGAKFPLKDGTKRAFSENDDLKKEEPVLINPLTESPENFIKYDILENDKNPLMIKAVGKCERGDKTINELTGINDKELLRERAECVGHYRILYKCFSVMKNNLEAKKEIYEEIKKKLESGSQFAGLARFYFNQVGLNNI